MRRLVVSGLGVAVGVMATLATPVPGQANTHPLTLSMREPDTIPPPTFHRTYDLRFGRVVVFLDRDGEPAPDGVRQVLPRFGGGDDVWDEVVACVRDRYALFKVDIVSERPTRGDYIHAVFGGLAAMKDLDDATTNGIAPMSGEVLPTATAYIFSQGGTGEHDVANLCRVAAHEIGHTLGLDHEEQCGDIMSYCYTSGSPTPVFMDVDARCGEDAQHERDCAYGTDRETTQNSYRRLVEKVGLRKPPTPLDPYAEPLPKRVRRVGEPTRFQPAPVDPYR